MILTISGASGAGKTTIARALLEQLPNAKFLHSYTTRSPRQTDIPGEFTYLNRHTFESMRQTEEFIWAADFGETSMGTRISDLDRALKDRNKLWITVLLPDVLPRLFAYAKQVKKEDAIQSVYIKTECDDVLRKRMLKRGDMESQVEERLKLCKTFDDEAKYIKIPFIWVKNDRSIQDVLTEIEDALEKTNVCPLVSKNPSVRCKL
jgi:guanylate kinase